MKSHCYFKYSLLLVCAVLCFLNLSMTVCATGPYSLVNNTVTVTETFENSYNDSGTWGSTLNNDGSVTVTLTAKGGSYLGNEVTGTITVKNNSGSEAELSFNYLAQGYGAQYSWTTAFSESSSSGEYSERLPAGGTKTITIRAYAGRKKTSTATLTLSNFSLTVVQDAAVTINYDNSLGSVTADGNVVAPGLLPGKIGVGESVALNAVASSGVSFFGWIDESNNRIISQAATFSYSPISDSTIKPVFVSNSDTTPWFSVGNANQQTYQYIPFVGTTYYYHTVSDSYLFNDLEKAATFASGSANKYIVLKNNGTLPAKAYTIPQGVTLLIPFDAEQTLYTSSGTIDASATTSGGTVSVYRTLTMPKGASLTINGTLSLSNRVTLNTTTPVGPCSFINMQQGSSMSVNGTLYAYGFITGNGTITANSGSTIIECFQMMDWRGGQDTTKWENAFPLSQFYFQNIEVPLTIMYGATEKCFAAMSVTAVGPVGDFATLISNSSAMFLLGDASSSIKKTYDGSTDRLKLDIAGSASISPVTISISGYDLNTGEYTLALNNNFVVTALPGAKFYLTQNFAVLPGTELYIQESAYLYLQNNASLYVYDRDEWGPYCGSKNQIFIPLTYAPSKTYTRTDAKDLKDALIQVDGTLDASSGHVYTTAGGANICSSKKGVVILPKGTETTTVQYRQNIDSNGTDEAVDIPITPAKLKNSNNSYAITANSSTNPNTYTYLNGFWRCATHTDGDVATCTTAQLCTVCQYTLKAALGHTEVIDVAVPPTCTASGLTEGCHCSVCSEVLTKQTEVGALGHAWGDQAQENGNLHIHSCTRNCGKSITLNVAYRLDDYLWFNGYFVGVDITKVTGATSAPVEKEGITTTYVVDAIPAKEIPDALSFTVTFTMDGASYSCEFTVSLANYNAGDKEALKSALLSYGDAAKDYFDTDTNLSDGHTVTGNTVGDGFKLSQTGDPIPWNGVTLETTAANIYFDEALRLGISYQLSGIPEGYTIKQIGLLVGELSSESEELTLEKHNMAYLLFNAIPNGSVVDGDTIQNAEIGKYPENGPWDSDDKIIVMPDGTFTVPTISEKGTSGTIVFDLKAQEYKAMFSLRPAIVFEKDGKYVCVYGRQIGYGLGAYINGVYATDSEGKALATEYNYLLEQLWALAGVTSPATGG